VPQSGQQHLGQAVEEALHMLRSFAGLRLTLDGLNEPRAKRIDDVCTTFDLV